jgi:nucleotide-binding universal stress UspA family protein
MIARPGLDLPPVGADEGTRLLPGPDEEAVMNAPVRAGSVVVGVDSSVDGRRAVRWALDHAMRTYDPVHFVHIEVDIDDGGATTRAAEQLLQDALAEADLLPGVRATADRVTTSRAGIGPVLVRMAEDAAMLVVGARGHGTVTGTLMGSLSQYAARHATCPVLVSRAVADPRAGRVVAGVDDSHGARAVLEHAFAHAFAHGLELTVLHAWQFTRLGYRALALPRAGLGEHLAAGTRVLTDRLEEWTAKYPEVVVTPEVRVGHAATILAKASKHATLVVVGTREGSGPVASVGSVSQALLREATRPVLVVR